MHGLRALRAPDVDPPLLQLNLDVALQASQAGQVVAVPQQGELIDGDHDETQGALPDLQLACCRFLKFRHQYNVPKIVPIVL